MKISLKLIILIIATSVVSCTKNEVSYVEDSSFAGVCMSLPVPANKILPLSDASTEWFQVWKEVY